MAKKPLLMFLSDSPAICTGMGIAHKEFAKRLYATKKYDIISVGWFHEERLGWPFPWQLIVLPDRAYGHPKNWPNSSLEDLKECSLNKIIEKHRPDIVISIADAWMSEYIAKLPSRKTFKWIWEFPIDGEPVPKQWIRDIKQADMPIVMTKYAERVIRDIDPNIYLERIPRGITEDYYKLAISKEEAKKKCSPNFENRFLIACVARFQDRKQLGRGVEALSKFIRKYKREDALLYLHCDIQDPASGQLYKTLKGEDGMIERYHMENYVAYDTRITVEKGVTPERLNLLYNAFDVQIMPTQGEGWGLPLVESMAAGTPCIATDFTSCRELIEGHGKLSKVKSFITGMYNVERALVDTDHMADQIEEYYRNPEQRDRDGMEASKFVRQFKWDTIIRVWQMHIDKLLKPYKYILSPEEESLTIPTDKINICGAVKENTGWAITTRGLANGLESIGKNISIYESGGSIPGYKLNENIEKMMLVAKNTDVDVINHSPDYQEQFLDNSTARIKVSYFPWELTKFKSDWVYYLNRKSDLYLCPSKFIKRIAIESGVNDVALLPLAVTEGIDTSVEPIKFSDKKYHFLAIGQMGDPRKNVKFLIKAFLHTFTGDDDVALVIKCNPGFKRSDPTEIGEWESLGLKNPPRIVIIHNEVGTDNISKMYKSCDCLVHVSCAEGWGQPVLEAMKFGMPVIAPMYGGYMDFANEILIPVKYRIVDARDSLSYIDGSKWCMVDFNDLSRVMRETYDKGITKDGIDRTTEFTWKNTAKILDHHIQKLSKPKKTIKVYFETGVHSLWNEDNEYNLKKFAPRNVEFIQDYSEADLQILNVTRLADRYLLNNKNYIVLMHTYGEWAEEPHNDYHKLFKDAKLVYSHLDLSEHNGINYMRGPWGVDLSKFVALPGKSVKFHDIFSTGFVAQTEGISEILSACITINGKMIHTGPKLFDDPHYTNLGLVDVNRLREVYNGSKYTNALRRVEGFEKTVSEGILSGSRPICFDTPLYRYWYEDLVEYVKEGSFDDTRNDLIKVLSTEPREVTEEEQKIVENKFGWINVARSFWERVLKTI